MRTGNTRVGPASGTAPLRAAYRALRYRIDLGATSLAHRIRAAPEPRRLLLVSDATEYTSEQQLAPFRRHRAQLRSRLGLATLHRLDAELRGDALACLASFDLVLFKLSFRTSGARAIARARELASAKGSARLVYFDGDDDACVLWPDLLEHVDLYVKKQVFRDPAQYQRSFVGKSNLTDHVHRTSGVSFAEDIIPAAGPVDPRLARRIHLGFNVACDDKIVETYQKSLAWPELERDNDVICRASVPADNWIRGLREPASERISALADRVRVLTPSQRVPQDVYYDEMRRSRICVSPFGYGEVCWRDFEAILCGCLLVKPDMSHLRTEPDIFRPFETFVPVRWDYSDLEEKCLHYLHDEAERRRIVERAHAVLADYYRSDRVLDQVAEMLHALGLAEGAAAPGLVPDGRNLRS